ncbi:RagB/SusD family nutrient uptake outer membrane protein [Pseudoflavitalea sp. X16]|uniref:RagB/SusD family nutrient uptake outer membrane protein n=1 Tax=Paraflavitalea devenefica TaxID=2716334 RepID=UPI0014216166|nr:RagB/SusD family nutrient uptake outer membrane protein [Paraflavitalea devenefica]NII28026.1 RagB/SusD family nutrient uptake outer membrane protein [Paraflavitalea devenefica]
MKKRSAYLLPGLAVLFLLPACKKDWLSPANENILVATDSTFLKPENATSFVTMVYNQLTVWNTATFSWIGVSSITSDDADKGSSAGDNGGDKNLMDALTYTPTSGSVIEVWTGNYQGIKRANEALANVPKYQIDAALKTRLLAEARFLRAYFYFTLVRTYGGVPIVDTALDANNPADFERANIRRTKEEVYAFIEEDLNYALSILPTKQEYGAANIGRASKGAAAALLAKVSMYQQKWDQVLSLTNAIIAGTYGTYGLEPDFTRIWREVGENGMESLFEVQGKGTVTLAGVQQYSQVQAMRGATFSGVTNAYSGWGFNTPSANLDSAFEAGDVRKNATIIHIGDTLWDGVILVNASNPRYNRKAYVSKTQETYSSDSYTNKNVRILRMGEVYLMNAEAANEKDLPSQAQTSLNAVRNRAGLANTTAAAKADLKTAIWNERRVELAMEHDRFFDLVRQGRAGTLMRAHGKAFIDGKHEVFPIPQTQIDNSGGIMKQNDKY